jgi:hypothetical protein
MRLLTASMLISSLACLGACSDGRLVEVPNNDGAALVQALREANAGDGHTRIRLARNGLYVLAAEAQPGLLLPAVLGRVTLEGNHAEIRGYSARPAAILEVAAEADVRISHLVLAEGTDGAVRNYGDLRLQGVAVVDSSVDAMPAIVLNHGRLQATDSEIAYNLLLATPRDSGTVLNYGEIELTGSRIHDNRALGSQPSVAVSGGILNFGSVTADGLAIQDNELPSDVPPNLSFGGILNLGNGKVTGLTDGVRDANRPAALAGL